MSFELSTWSLSFCQMSSEEFPRDWEQLRDPCSCQDDVQTAAWLAPQVFHQIKWGNNHYWSSQPWSKAKSYILLIVRGCERLRLEHSLDNVVLDDGSVKAHILIQLKSVGAKTFKSLLITSQSRCMTRSCRGRLMQLCTVWGERRLIIGANSKGLKRLCMK